MEEVAYVYRRFDLSSSNCSRVLINKGPILKYYTWQFLTHIFLYSGISYKVYLRSVMSKEDIIFPINCKQSKIYIIFVFFNI